MRIILNLPESASPEEVQREYRKLLFLKGASGSEKNPPAFDLAKVQKVVEQEKGELSLGERYLPEEATASKGAVTKRTRPEDQQSTVSFFWDLGTSFG